MAYVDGQLGAEERSHVESLIESNPDDARLVEQWREQGDLLRSMPKFNLDERFADRVMAAIEFDDPAAGESETRIQSHGDPASGVGSEAATHWRTGAAAIATLAALLLLTLFVFPNTLDQPTVAVNTPGEPAGQNTPAATTTTSGGGVNDSLETATDADRRNGEQVVGPVVGLSKPPLNKTLAGSNLANEPKDLIQPLQLSERADSLAEVLWVDMKSHRTALADIESVILKNSMTILPASSGTRPNQANSNPVQNHLEQRPNSRLEALQVIATRDQIRKTILELSQQHEAKFHAVTLHSTPGALPTNIDPSQTYEAANGTGPTGNIPHLTRLKGSPNSSGNRLSSGAIVQQLRAIDLSSNEQGRLVDEDELQQLNEWFDLAEKMDESSVVRLLLLVDTSPND